MPIRVNVNDQEQLKRVEKIRCIDTPCSMYIFLTMEMNIIVCMYVKSNDYVKFKYNSSSFPCRHKSSYRTNQSTLTIPLHLASHL